MSNTLNTTQNTSNKNIFNKISNVNTDNNNNKLFKLLTYIYISILYEEYYESNYLLIIFNLFYKDSQNESTKNIIRINDLNKISDIIKDYKFKYNHAYREYKKDSSNNNDIFKSELINKKNEYNEYTTSLKNDILDLDNEIIEKDFKKKLEELKQKSNEKNKLYKTEKLKQNKLNSELSNLDKISDAGLYKIKALDKISDSRTRKIFDDSIKEFILSKTDKMTKKSPPDNEIIEYIKKLVEQQIKKNKNIKSSNNIKILQNNKNKYEKEKYEFELEYNDILKRKELFTLYIDNYEKIYVQEIDKIIKNIDSTKNKNDEDKKKIQIILNDEFTKLINLCEKIEKINNINKYNTIDNKIYFYVKEDNILKSNYFKNMSEFNSNINNIYEGHKKFNLSNINNNIKKKLKLSNSNNENDSEKIKKIFKLNYLETYISFLNNYFTKQKFYFINEINNIYNNLDENNEIRPFFEEYMNHFKKLSFKINNLLNQINLDIITFNIEKINSLDPYFNIIGKKIENIKKINKNSDVNIQNNKGNFTTILPYTDSMFLYIIYLTLIIDYLTFFYE
jgi:hypothetical protein